MKHIPLIFSLTLAVPFLTSCGGSPDSPAAPSQPAVTTGAEASLTSSINQTRAKAGKKPLKRSRKLDAIAANEAARLAASGGREPNISALHKSSGYSRTSVLIGSLKDRGPETGAKFPSYWMKTERGKKYLMSDWHRLGVGTAKSEKGELVSIAVFGDFGGASLLYPMY